MSFARIRPFRSPRFRFSRRPASALALALLLNAAFPAFGDSVDTGRGALASAGSVGDEATAVDASFAAFDAPGLLRSWSGAVDGASSAAGEAGLTRSAEPALAAGSGPPLHAALVPKPTRAAVVALPRGDGPDRSVFGGVVAALGLTLMLGLTLLAGINSRKRWPSVMAGKSF